MPDPSKSAGGSPDDWGAANDGKDGCKGIFLIMLLVGVVQVAQLVGYLTLIGRVLS